MPAKSGGSHALAALVSIMLGAILSSYIELHAPTLAKWTIAVGSWLRELGAPISKNLAGILVIVPILSFVWGVFYHFGRHGG